METILAQRTYTELPMMRETGGLLALTLMFRIALLAAGALTLAACAASDVPVSTAIGNADAPTGEYWRTDLAVGGREQQVAHATPVLLANGSTTTLESLAEGRPLLLYFYATW